jgi:simple sugar transport system ATP-binding protein
MTDIDPIIRTERLSKSFGNIQAVQEASIEIPEGEVMAVVGDNGAGKSTFIKMLCGVLAPTSGDIYVRDQRVEFQNYNDAREAGIETVYQDLALVLNQSVAANVFLGHEPVSQNPVGRLLKLVDEDRMIRESHKALNRVRIPVDPTAKVSNLSGGQQQAVAIARALQSNPDILIMDEPTSALSIEGARNVLKVIDGLRADGLTVVLISHNIRHVMTIADHIAVLAQGRSMGVRKADESSREEIIAMMMGMEDESEFEEFDLSSSPGGTSA